MFRDLGYELTRGLAYRKIRHAHQHVYTTLLPFIGAVFFTLAYALAPEKIALLGKDGILASALSVISTLPGFYFAGLAAVATFGGVEMDKDIPDPAPELLIRHRGAMIDTKLSRRKYISYLFSYLVFVSFLLCVSILILNGMQPSILAWKVAALSWMWGNLICMGSELLVVFSLMLMASSLTVATLQGLFFLSERIHQP